MPIPDPLREACESLARAVETLRSIETDLTAAERKDLRALEDRLAAMRANSS